MAKKKKLTQTYKLHPSNDEFKEDIKMLVNEIGAGDTFLDLVETYLFILYEENETAENNRQKDEISAVLYTCLMALGEIKRQTTTNGKG